MVPRVSGPNIESRMLNSLFSSFSAFSTQWPQSFFSTHHDKTDNRQYPHGRLARQLLLINENESAWHFLAAAR
jgi:hypothetical protein